MSKNKPRLTVDLSRKAWLTGLKQACENCKIKQFCQSSCYQAHYQAHKAEQKRRKQKLELKKK